MVKKRKIFFSKFLKITSDAKAKLVDSVKKPSLAFAILKTHIGKFIGVLFLKILHDTLNFARPVLLE